MLYLGGLDCANCARKIEDKVSSMSETKDTSLNFIKKTLKFKFDDTINQDILIKKVRDIIDDTEPGLDVKIINDDIVIENYSHEEGSC